MNPYRRRRIDRMVLAAYLIALWILFLPFDYLLVEEPVTLEMLRNSFFSADFKSMTRDEKAEFFRVFRQKLLSAENFSRRRFERSDDFVTAYSDLSTEDQELFVETMMPEQTRRIIHKLLALSPEERNLVVNAAYAELPEKARGPERVQPEDVTLLKEILAGQTDSEVRQMLLAYFFRQAQEHERINYRPLINEIFRILRHEKALRDVLSGNRHKQESKEPDKDDSSH